MKAQKVWVHRDLWTPADARCYIRDRLARANRRAPWLPGAEAYRAKVHAQVKTFIAYCAKRWPEEKWPSLEDFPQLQ